MRLSIMTDLLNGSWDEGGQSDGGTGLVEKNINVMMEFLLGFTRMIFLFESTGHDDLWNAGYLF